MAPTLTSLPRHRDLFYGGEWHAPKSGRYFQSANPATMEILGEVAEGGPEDAEAIMAAAQAGFETWRQVIPSDRARTLREAAALVRQHGDELAFIDSLDGGNPLQQMRRDAARAADSLDFFAGLVTEIKGDSIPVAPGSLNFTVREPVGVVARMGPFNHPFLFTAAKAAAPLAAGNSVIMKPPEIASLSSLRLAEIIGGLFPPGVFNVVTGGREMGATLAGHPRVAMVTLIESVPTGRAVMRAASDTVKPVLLELGGKNALIAFPDADPDEVALAMTAGMNFTWCGQSCGSTSRAFVHEAIHDAVLECLKTHIAHYRPGIPIDPATTMGAIASKQHFERIINYIQIAKEEGATLFWGGQQPCEPELARGYFLKPTVFVNVKQTMRIAREEVFGSILSVLRWNDEQTMLGEVNGVEYGLTSSIWTNNLQSALRVAQSVQAGYVWINETSKHFQGAPFGGVKQSGIGREECLSELLSFTQEKNIHVRITR